MAQLPLWPPKDPGDTLDYLLDWSLFLDSDTISSAVWTVPSGLTKTAQSETTTTTTVWLSGGTADTLYTLDCTITTAGGRTAQRRVGLYVEEL